MVNCPFASHARDVINKRSTRVIETFKKDWLPFVDVEGDADPDGNDDDDGADDHHDDPRGENRGQELPMS